MWLIAANRKHESVLAHLTRSKYLTVVLSHFLTIHDVLPWYTRWCSMRGGGRGCGYRPIARGGLEIRQLRLINCLRLLHGRVILNSINCALNLHTRPGLTGPHFSRQSRRPVPGLTGVHRRQKRGGIPQLLPRGSETRKRVLIYRFE